MARDEGSHIWEHQSEYHSEEEIRMKFEVVKICRTALERQVSETVNIKMRSREGSKILNSKIEYNRCFIPSLTVLGQGGVSVSPSKVKVKVTVPASVTIVDGTVSTTGKSHITNAITAVKLCEPAKVTETVPTTVPHVIQAIEAVKLCEGAAEVFFPVRTLTQVKGAFPVSAPSTTKPHIIQAIAAVKICEGVEGVESILPSWRKSIRLVDKPHIIQAIEAVKLCVTTPVPAIEGTVTASVPYNLTPGDTNTGEYRCLV